MFDPNACWKTGTKRVVPSEQVPSAASSASVCASASRGFTPSVATTSSVSSLTVLSSIMERADGRKADETRRPLLSVRTSLVPRRTVTLDLALGGTVVEASYVAGGPAGYKVTQTQTTAQTESALTRKLGHQLAALFPAASVFVHIHQDDGALLPACVLATGSLLSAVGICTDVVAPLAFAAGDALLVDPTRAEQAECRRRGWCTGAVVFRQGAAPSVLLLDAAGCQDAGVLGQMYGPAAAVAGMCAAALHDALVLV